MQFGQPMGSARWNESGAFQSIGIDADQSAVSSGPDKAIRRLSDVKDSAAAEKIWRTIDETYHFACPWFENVQAVGACAGPDPLLSIDVDGTNDVGRQGVRLRFCMKEAQKSVGAPRPFNYPGTLGRQPKIMMAIFGNLPNKVAAQTGSIGPIAVVSTKRLAVKSIETVLSAEPNEAFGILCNRGDVILGEPLAYTDDVKAHLRQLRCAGRLTKP